MLSLLIFLVTGCNCITIETVDHDLMPKKAVVLNCFTIRAENGIPDNIIEYVGSMAAQLLDNDLDGSVDDPAVAALMNSNREGYGIDIFLSERSNAAENYQTNSPAVLYLTEIDPNNPGIFQRDATFEEVMHNINYIQSIVYPTELGLTSFSNLALAMDIARGGKFPSVPSTYPPSAWFTYDDETCEYECQMIEYLYWGMGSYLGFFDDTGICSQFSHEWKICNAEDLESTDPALYAIITDPKLKLPRNKPGSTYNVGQPNNPNNPQQPTSATTTINCSPIIAVGSYILIICYILAY